MRRFLHCLGGLLLVVATLFVTPVPTHAQETGGSLPTEPVQLSKTEAPQTPPKKAGQLLGLKEKMDLAKREGVGTTFKQRLLSFFGLLAYIGIAYLFSWDRANIDWKLVGWGISLQLIFGLLILKTSGGQWVFAQLNTFFGAVIDYTAEGSKFLFGGLNSYNPAWGMPFAFAILPSIIFFSSLMAVLYHLGVVQKFVLAMAFVMERTMGVSGAEALSSAANVFVGQTEAPLVVRPFVPNMTMSELNALMCGGMATVAGGVLAAYVGMGVDAGHLLSASVMSAPASLVIAKILIPETGEPETKGKLELNIDLEDVNVVDAAARGAGEGLQLALNVGAMLLAFIALIAMVNGMFGLVAKNIPGFPPNLQTVCGYLFAPTAWLMGIQWDECLKVGQLLGVKTIVNEFVAYQDMANIAKDLSPRSLIITTYALCGFANFSSIAIQIGGLGAMAPERRQDLAKLGLWCLLGGTLACYMTATVAGMLI